MTNETIKIRITKAVLEQLPDKSVSLDDALKRWYYNIRLGGGLRLSEVGNMAFVAADIEYFDFPFPVKKANMVVSIHKFMLDLNYKMPCPYYIQGRQKQQEPFFRVYDSKVAMLIALYGDVIEYINATNKKR